MAIRRRSGVFAAAVSMLIGAGATADPPVNDDCIDALVVVNGESVIGTVIDATIDGASACDTSGNRDVWYMFEAPSPGTLTVTTCGTNDAPGLDRGMDTILSLHAGCPGTVGNEIACNDNWFAAGVGDACAADDAGVRTDSVVGSSLDAGQIVLVRVTWKQLFLRDGMFMMHVAFEGETPSCPCETDGVGGVDIFDLLGYLDAWFAGSPTAERDGRTGIDIFDLLSYLDCWFDVSSGGGCP